MHNPKTITIVHLITSLNVGGAERMLSNLVLGMDRARFTNIVISLQDQGYWGPILTAHGIKVYSLNMRPSPTALIKLFKLWQLLRQYKPQYIQGWMYHANILASVIGKLAGIKQVFWNIRCSLMDLSNYRFTTALIFKAGTWLAKHPSKVINNSQASIQQHTVNGYGDSKWLYIPNGFDTNKFKPNIEIYQQFRQQHNLPANAILIAMFARFDPMKDHATFLDAAAILAAQQPNVYFILAGKGVDKTNFAPQERVILLGPVSKVETVLPAIDYLAQTSIYGEGFPNILGEAMACGVECFTTDIGDAKDVVGNTGVVVPCKDPIALAEQWSLALARDKQQTRHGQQAARERIVSKFSLDKVIHLYSECYSAIKNI